MKKIRLIIFAVCAVGLMPLLVSAELYNIQLNGLGSTYTGAAQVGSTGDTWNKPALSNIDGTGDTGSRTVVGGASLVDSSGTSSSVSLSVSAANYKGYYANASGGNPVTGLNNQGIKFDWNGANPVPTVTISLSGLPANAAVGLYAYGAGYNANTAGSTWTMAAGNGGAVGMCGYGGYYETGTPDGLDITLSSSRNLGWDLVEGTTDGSGNLSVVVTPVDGSYVNDIWWQTYMNGFQLLVYAAPAISNLVDETVIAGNSTVLSPVVTGVPMPVYQWQENGVDLTGETNATLALNNVQYSQDGKVYSLIASNQAGAATNSMTLSVIVTPTIEGLNNQTAQPGDLVTLAPTVSGVPAPSSQWLYNGGLLSDGATGNGSTVSGSTSDTLSISNAQVADSGTYSLVASNSAGVVTNSMTLTVSLSDVPPEISGPSDQTEVQGDDAIFNASVSGLPIPSLQWKLNGSDIPGETNSTLTLNNVQYSQNGEVYSLVASNTAGGATNSATLYVLVPPAITQQPTNTSAVVGTPAIFSVIAGGVPAVSYQWSRDGSPIAGATNSSYSIASVLGSDNGAVFSVVVSNSVDSVVSGSATLTVLSAISGTFLPTDGAVNIAPDQQLRIVFPSPVKLGGSGVITIHDASDDSVVAAIDRSTFLTYEPGNSSLTIPNAAIRNVQGSPYGTGIQSANYYYMPIVIYDNEVWFTFNPTERLDYGKSYYVNMDAGLLLATDDSAIAGIADATTWRFSTKGFGPATPTASTGPTEITIGLDGTGDFATFQGAFDWIPQNNTLARTILVKPGIYRDSATLAQNRDFITIVGEGASRTDAQLIYPYAYFAPPNTVFTAGSLRIESSDVTVQNLTLDNICYIEFHPTGDPSSGAPGDFAGAVNTVATTGDRIVFDDVLIKGGQDTLYTVKGIAYFNQCEIWGSVDFIYGEALAVFDQCTIVEIRDVGGPVGAPSTLLAAPYGLVFLDCSFPRALVANGYPYNVNVGSSTMMRSWRPDGHMAVINCEMGSQVSTKGWLEWSAKETTCRAREYGTTLIGGGSVTPAQRQAAGAYWLNTIDPDYTNNPALDPTDPLLYGSPGKDNRVPVTVNPADYTLDAIFGHSYFGLGSWRPSSVLANPPVVLTQPVGRAVAQGANVGLTVDASTSTGTTNYLWQMNSNNITAGNVSGITSSMLTITGFQAANEGHYYVVVDDGTRYTNSSSALLSLALVPSIINEGIDGDELTVQIPTEFGPSYLVQTNTDLTATNNWQVADAIVGDGTIKPFITGVTDSSQLFIRVKVQ